MLEMQYAGFLTLDFKARPGRASIVNLCNWNSVSWAVQSERKCSYAASSIFNHPPPRPPLGLFLPPPRYRGITPNPQGPKLSEYFPSQLPATFHTLLSHFFVFGSSLCNLNPRSVAPTYHCKQHEQLPSSCDHSLRNQNLTHRRKQGTKDCQHCGFVLSPVLPPPFPVFLEINGVVANPAIVVIIQHHLLLSTLSAHLPMDTLTRDTCQGSNPRRNVCFPVRQIFQYLCWEAKLDTSPLHHSSVVCWRSRCRPLPAQPCRRDQHIVSCANCCTFFYPSCLPWSTSASEYRAKPLPSTQCKGTGPIGFQECDRGGLNHPTYLCISLMVGCVFDTLFGQRSK